jgi:hypothetical protein
MSRISIPIDALTSRFNFSSRLDGVTSQSIATRFANLRPLGEFFDLKRLSKPNGWGEAQSRMNYNLGYFSSNYAGVMAMLSIYALLTNWALLFFIFIVVGGMWAIGKLGGQDLTIGNYRATTGNLYTTLAIVAVPTFFYANPWGTFLWLVGASAVAILGHASFMDKPIESAFSEEAV